MKFPTLSVKSNTIFDTVLRKSVYFLSSTHAVRTVMLTLLVPASRDPCEQIHGPAPLSTVVSTHPKIEEEGFGTGWPGCHVSRRLRALIYSKGQCLWTQILPLLSSFTQVISHFSGQRILILDRHFRPSVNNFGHHRSTHTIGHRPTFSAMNEHFRQSTNINPASADTIWTSVNIYFQCPW